MKEDNSTEEIKASSKDTMSDQTENNEEMAHQPGDQAAMPAGKKTKKIWYKNPWLWAGIAAATIGVVSITLGLIYRSNVLKTNQSITDGWVDITTQANQVVVLQNRLSQSKDYNAYSIQLHSMDNAINNRKFASDNLPTWLNNTAELNRYKDFLGQYSTYIGKSASLSDTPDKISSSDITSLGDNSKAAQSAAETLKGNSSFLQAPMPDDIYKIPTALQSVTDTLANTQKQSAADKQAAANATAQDAANLAAVNTSVTTFQNGFVAGNASAMRPVMTSGFQNEYNFNQLGPDQRQYQYPASFRIISTAKQVDGTYKSQINVIFRYHDSSDQYTQGYEYSVINSGGKWLLNNEKQTNSF